MPAVTAGSSKAIVFYQRCQMQNGVFVGGAVEQEYMSRGSDGAFVSSLDTHTDSYSDATTASAAMRVWIKSGDDEVYLPDITVVPRLTIKSITATVQPPAYVGDAAIRRRSI